MNARLHRYELLRTFRNRRFFFFSLGFPLVLYFLIAGPNRNEHDLGGSGISAPLYFMVGLAAFGTMNAMLVDRRADRGRALGRLEPPAADHAAPDADVLPREGARPGTSMALDRRSAVLYAAGASLGVRLPAGDWLRDDGLHPGRADPVRGARRRDRAPAARRLDRAGAWAAATALFALLGGTWFPITSGVMHKIGRGAAVVLARAGGPRRPLGGRPAGARPAGLVVTTRTGRSWRHRLAAGHSSRSSCGATTRAARSAGGSFR